MDNDKKQAMPSQVLLWSLPRSGCHLLERMVFSQQENVKYCWHPFESTVMPLHKWMQSEDIKDPSHPNRSEYEAEGLKDAQRWKEDLQEAKKAGRILYMHEHAVFSSVSDRLLEVAQQPRSRPDLSSRISMAPDDVLLEPGTIPLFTIRNPVLVVSSNFRAVNALYTGSTRANWTVNNSLRWNRDLYDWYVAHGIEPVVADADDYMSSEAFVRHLTSKVGLDPEKAIVSWKKSTEEEKKAMHPLLLPIQHTLVHSEGIRPDRASQNIDLAAEREKWKHEFSEEDYELVKELVDIAMPHYEYLRERRLRL